MTKIERNKIKIVKLLNENIDLEFKALMKKFVRTYKKELNLGTKKNPNIIIAKYGVFYQYFTDEDTGKKIRIERNAMIEINGERVGFTHYSLENI